MRRNAVFFNGAFFVYPRFSCGVLQKHDVPSFTPGSVYERCVTPRSKNINVFQFFPALGTTTGTPPVVPVARSALVLNVSIG